MAINRFSEIACFELIEYYLTVVTKWRSALTYISPESVEYSFFQAHSFQFVYAASRGIPLSPLSPRCPFCPAEPWIPGSPFAPFFPSISSILTRCPRGSWDACHVCPHPGLSTIITRWTRLNMLQKREKVNDKLRFNPGEEVLPYNFPSSNCFFFFLVKSSIMIF